MKVRAAIALLFPLVMAVTASAVLIDGSDGSVDVAPFSEPELDHIGTRGGLSAIYLGSGVVLTANHVGAGDVSFGGVVYPYLPGTAVQLVNSDGTYADLLMFAIYPRPNLPELPIVQTRPAYLSQLLIAGNGLDRGNSLLWDPNGSSAPGLTAGFAWGAGAHVRWGTNHVEVYPQGRVFNTQAFGSFFDAGSSLPEGQAVTGDSGGGAFSQSPLGGWELSGVMIGIVQYSGQPAGSSFFGQRTYYADVAYYRPQLVDAVELPEPDGGLAAGAALLGALAARRCRAGARRRAPARA